jgi:hypothetical protein
MHDEPSTQTQSCGVPDSAIEQSQTTAPVANADPQKTACSRAASACLTARK